MLYFGDTVSNTFYASIGVTDLSEEFLRLKRFEFYQTLQCPEKFILLMFD